MRNTIFAFAIFLSVLLLGTLVVYEFEPQPIQTVKLQTLKVLPLPIFYRTTFTAKEVDCLAKNVYYESRGESALGQLAVAQVTVNRWNQNPTRTICQVVYQAGQFSWTFDEARKQPSRKSATWQQAMNIAMRVLHNKECCFEVGNATYYHATYVKPKWAKKKKMITKIGNHIFYN